MKKKTRYRLKPLDVVIVVFCLCICFGSIFLFWKDLNKSSIRNDKDQIATITFKHRVAQRKYSDRVVWERLADQAPLYNMDTVRTADLADATITFLDGTVLELHENTMLQVAYGKEGVKLSVGGGNVVVDSSRSDKDVQIKMDNGSAINLAAGSKLSASSDTQSGESSFQVQSGSGSVKGEDGQKHIVGTGESVKLSNEGKIRKGGITVTSIASDVRVLSIEENSVPVHLEWSATEDFENSKIIIETSKTKDFAKVEKIYEKTGSSSIDLAAENGTLYWRIYPKEEQEEPVAGKVKVENIENIMPQLPPNGSIYKYRDEFPQIKFSWNGNEYVDHYKLEISDSPDFLDLIFDEDISVQSLNIGTLSEGKYYWRVTPFYTLNQIGYAEPTETRNFYIEKKIQAAAPQLSIPAAQAKLVYTQKDYSALFQWKSEVKSANYKLLVAADSDFQNVVYEKQIKNKTRLQTVFDTEQLKDGNYYWKVLRESEDDDGEISSEVRSFILSKYIPAKNRLIYPPDSFAVEETKLSQVNFQWKLGDSYKNQKVESVVQFSSSEKFDVVSEFKTDTTELKNIKLGSTGKYYWRLGVYDSVTEDFNYTDSRMISVLSELSLPKITLPKANSTLLVQNNTPLLVKWNKVDGADYYNVKIFDSDGNEIDEKSDVRGTQTRFELNLDGRTKQKQLKVSVQPFAEETEYSSMRVGKQTSINFDIRNPKPVLLNSPVNNQSYDGLKALRSPIILSWTAQEDKPDYTQLILRKVQPTGATKIVQKIDNPEKTVYLERLTEGTYQWTVKANTKDGFNLDADGYKTFVIGSVPELSQAKLVEPENNFVMGPAYLRKHRNLSFEWNAVVGATDYVFVLYAKTEDGLKKLYSQETKEPSVKIKDLTILDVGDFEWQVTAYCYATDGFEEQHSKASIGRFKIDFKKPKKIETKDPGRLYAE